MRSYNQGIFRLPRILGKRWFWLLCQWRQAPVISQLNSTCLVKHSAQSQVLRKRISGFGGLVELEVQGLWVRYLCANCWLCSMDLGLNFTPSKWMSFWLCWSISVVFYSSQSCLCSGLFSTALCCRWPKSQRNNGSHEVVDRDLSLSYHSLWFYWWVNDILVVS